MALKYGRTQPQKKTIWTALKSLDIRYLKSIRWQELPPEQKKKILVVGIVCFFFLLAFGLFSQNDEDMLKDTINEFIKESAVYNVNGVSKTTTSSAHQLVVGQAQKLNQTKGRNYKTLIDDTEINIVSKDGKSMIATAKVESTEQIGSEPPKKFSHAFIFQGQKVGATWKISNLLESEARLSNRSDDKK